MRGALRGFGASWHWPLVAGALLAHTLAAAQTIQLLNPRQPASATTREFVNVLARTEPGSIASIGGQPVPVYGSGVFVRDRVPLALGDNRIVIEVRQASGAARQLELTVRRDPPPPPPAPVTDRLSIEEASLRPRVTHIVDERETLAVGFSGTPGMAAEMRWGDGPWRALIERRPGEYVGRLLLRDDFDRAELPIQFRLSAPPGNPLDGQPPVTAQAPGGAGLWRSEGVRLYLTGANATESTDLVHGLHEVRLGGPFLTELPPGVMLRATGRVGDSLRVELAPGVTAWAPSRALAEAPAGSALPGAPFLTLNISGSAEGDTVDIPWPTRAPYAVQAATTPEGQPYLDVELFGTHRAATWITQRASARLVREASVEQIGEQRVRVRITLQQRRLWGWSVERRGEQLRLRVHAAPVLETAPGLSPLAGLRIALEAGHGSAANLGAVGPTGTPEKDINRWTTDALRAELEAAGARVVDIRVGDENPNLRERAKAVVASAAQLFVSIHANAAETTNGYLRAAGTGTFYKHATSRDLAAAVQRRLLDATALPDLGLVGSFNYAPTRLVTQMPAILVEQAFVSNPAEEALLLDPAFRQRIARAIRLGIEDFLRARP